MIKTVAVLTVGGSIDGHRCRSKRPLLDTVLLLLYSRIRNDRRRVDSLAETLQEFFAVVIEVTVDLCKNKKGIKFKIRVCNQSTDVT